MKRRLAAILAADVVGYSRLMNRDEEGTLALLTAHREEILEPTIAKHHGRIVKLMGDGVLVEFASIVDAVRCAADIQKETIARGADFSEDRRMQLRIGINLGDVIVEGEDIYGDGVNIAARLQELALPDGIYISDEVHRLVESKLGIAFEDLGEQILKNISRPIRVYRVDHPGQSDKRASAPANRLPLPDKPSIAVLPFINMSGDPAQEYFSDGMAEDIITALARYRWFFVIARSSSFAYKGRSIDTRQVARELGVRYVLEGSVRKAQSSVRVTAQLVDATTGSEIWAERYDRELADMFTVQDDITETIVAAVEPELGTFERGRAHRKQPENLDAWHSYQRGLWHFYGDWTRDGLAEAKRHLKRACELDPEFASAHAELAFAHIADVIRDFTDSAEASIEKATDSANMAVALDPRDPAGRSALGRIFIYRHEFDRAVEETRAAVALSPSSDRAHYCYGLALLYGGRPDESIPQFSKALRLNPRSPMSWAYLTNLGRSHFLLANYDEALLFFERATQHPNVTYLPFAHTAATLGQLGRMQEARAALAELKKRKPDFSVDTIRRTIGAYGLHAGTEQIIEGLLEAGLEG